MPLQMFVSFSSCRVDGVHGLHGRWVDPNVSQRFGCSQDPPQLPMKSTPEFSPLDVTYCLLHLCGSATVTPSVGNTHRRCVAANLCPPSDKPELGRRSLRTLAVLIRRRRGREWHFSKVTSLPV